MAASARTPVLPEAIVAGPLLCRFLDAGNTETLRMVGEPASKKRRGTKSREAGERAGGERYEVLALGNSKSCGLETRAQLKRFGTIVAEQGI